jgi:hypothetical protein
MTPEFRQKQAELMAATVAKNDMVICTALVQGGKAPVLVTQAMVDAMKPGSVVVDLASDGGGNCAATKPGSAITTDNGVKVLGYYNWPSRIPVAASTLYAKNLLTFLTTFWDKEAQAPKLPTEDDIVKGVMLTRGGAIVHKNFAAGTAAPTPVASPVPEAPAEEPAPAAEPPSTFAAKETTAPLAGHEPPSATPDQKLPAVSAVAKPKTAIAKAKPKSPSAATATSTAPAAEPRATETPPAPDAHTDTAP